MQQKIFSGEYQIGQQLPPERELAQELGVSRSLVNTGILELANQGFIRIIPRQGSIVADYKKNGTLQVLSALMNCDSSSRTHSESVSLWRRSRFGITPSNGRVNSYRVCSRSTTRSSGA